MYAPLQGRRYNIARGNKYSRLRARENFPPPMIFAPLWAYFSIFSLYIVRIAKSSGGGAPPLRSSAYVHTVKVNVKRPNHRYIYKWYIYGQSLKSFRITQLRLVEIPKILYLIISYFYFYLHIHTYTEYLVLFKLDKTGLCWSLKLQGGL